MSEVRSGCRAASNQDAGVRVSGSRQAVRKYVLALATPGAFTTPQRTAGSHSHRQNRHRCLCRPSLQMGRNVGER